MGARGVWLAFFCTSCAASSASTPAPPLHALAEDAAARIDEGRLVSWIDRLQRSGAKPGQLGTRACGTEGDRLARDAIAEALAGMGYDVARHPVELEQIFAPGTRVLSENLVVSLGPETGPRLIVLAHGDSRAAQNLEDAKSEGWIWDETPAPGADDNGSGSAALVEIARALRSLPRPPAHGVDLVWAACEEMARTLPGDWMVNIGAEPLADRFAASGQPELGAISVDMLLRARPWGHSFRVYSDGHLSSELLADALVHGAALVAPAAWVRRIVEPAFTWSDHGSFWWRGFGGVLFIEDDFHHVRYHRKTDALLAGDNFYDPTQLAAGAKILAAAIVLRAY